MLIFHSIFIENGNTLAIRLGIPIEKEYNPTPDKCYLVFGAHDVAAVLIESQAKSKCKFIIMNSEPPTSNHLRNKFYLQLMRDNIVFDYHPVSTEFLQKQGIKVFSHYTFEFPELVNDTPRSIDILFVGSKSPKREDIMRQLTEAYPDKKVVSVFDSFSANPADYTALLHQASTVINIPFYEHTILEMHRINKSLACGCKVVSYKSNDKETDNLYGEFIDFTLDMVEYFKKNHTGANSTYGQLVRCQSFHTRHNKWVLEKLEF